MFTNQDSFETGPARKREREDEFMDNATGGTLGFSEHRSKRLQALPVRTSPASKRWSLPANFPTAVKPPYEPNSLPGYSITPSDSGSEEAGNPALLHHHPQQVSHWASSPGLSVQQDWSSGMDTDMDMDMDTPGAVAEQQPSDRLEPGPAQPDSIGSDITGRIPTPINPNFALQVRGSNWGGAAGNVMQSYPDSFSADSSALSTGLGGQAIHLADRSVPRSLDHTVMADWTMVQNRRLPSPISENGGEENSFGSSRMLLDSAPHAEHPLIPPRASSANGMWTSPGPPLRTSSVDNMSIPGNSEVSSKCSDMNGMEPSTPSPKRGHTRSKHTLNSWTQQVGMKKSFSIGYRSDCEKCRLKVPGHFNHIIIS